MERIAIGRNIALGVEIQVHVDGGSKKLVDFLAQVIMMMMVN